MTETSPTSPSTAIARRPVTLGRPQLDLDEAYRLSQSLAIATVVPSALHGKPADVLAILLYGQDLGLSPMQSLQGIYVVKGKPLISGQLWIALARKRGHAAFVACKSCAAPPERHNEADGHRYEADHDATRCTFTVVRGDTEARHTETFTIEDAKTARLLSNDNWSKYPKRMLLWRAATDTMRVICPEIALGYYTDGDDLSDDMNTVEQGDAAGEDITEAEIVPEKVDAEVANLAEQYDFSKPRKPGSEPKVEELPPPPADLVCETCGTVGEHYEDECPQAAKP